MQCPKCKTDNPGESVFCAKCGTQISATEEKPLPTQTIEAPKEELTTGSTFAERYQIIEELGKGGMGKVYKVHDTKIKEKIALKLIKPEIAKDKKTIERFSNELRLTRKIRHKNVCQMFDLGEVQGTQFITMEYVPGEDLSSSIRRFGQLPVGKSISIANQICEGLAEAHRLGVVHRDLKSNNIMIDQEGNVRIMDFGIARSLEAKSITDAGVMIGTPEYMSPEQVEGKETDQRSDIYSLGIILYEMVTGRVPFQGDTPFTIGMKHKSEMPENPKELNTQIPDDLNNVILKCLDKDKEKRYQSTGEVRSELVNIEKEIPTTERIVTERKPLTSKEITVKLTPKKLLIPAAAVVILISAGLFLLLRPKVPGLDPKRVVVTAFENKTGNPAHDQIGWMAADRLTQGLDEVGLMTVVPSSSVETIINQYQGEDIISFLADKTGAGTVVSGAFYLEGENIEFHALIIGAESGEIIRAIDPVGGPAKDPSKPIIALQQKLMGVLALRFDPLLKDFAPIMSDPPNYEAFQEFREGVQYFVKRDYDKAIEHDLRAAAYDPNFVFPLLHAAVAYLNLGQYAKADELSQKINVQREKLVPAERHWLDWLLADLQGNLIGQYKVWKQLLPLVPTDSLWYYQAGLDAIRVNYPQEAVEALEKVDLHNPMIIEWYYYWANLTKAHHMLGNHEDELKAAQQGRRQSPELLSTHWYEVRALAALGKIEEVNSRLDESLTFPPQRGWNPAWVMAYAGNELRAHGYKASALQAFERAILWVENRPEEEKKNRSLQSLLGYVQYGAERWQEAQNIYQSLHDQFPDSMTYQGYLGAIAARLGNREKALSISEELKNIERPYLFGNNTYWRACIASLLGAKEQAMVLLRDSLAQGVSYGRLHADMDLEPLSDYPPFKELIKPKG